MFEIKLINTKERTNTEYIHPSNGSHYAVLENEQVVAYLTFNINENKRMWLDMIEVIDKEMGKGTSIIKFLFQYFSLSSIEGYILEEERAYCFWVSLGAKVSVNEIVHAGLDSPFSLTLN